MDTPAQARKLLSDTTQFHKDLVIQARDVSKLMDLLAFVADCISFAEKYLPTDLLKKWSDSDKTISELAKRTQPLFGYSTPDPKGIIYASISTASTAGTAIFTRLTNGYNFLEGKEQRDAYYGIALRFKGFVTGEEERKRARLFLASFNPVAAEKFWDSSEQLRGLPRDEDPQGPLMALRSALDLTVGSLLKMTPLTKSERSSLTQPALLPTIANHLANDDAAKVDLILANETFIELWKQLSAAKNTKVERDVAESLALRATSMLNLISRTVVPRLSSPADVSTA